MRPADRPSGGGRPDPIVGALVYLASALAVVVVLAPHAARYFYLFDDFALVSIAGKGPLSSFFATAVGGFYRPVALCGARLEALAFGWGHPGGYAAVSVLLHALVALLSGALLRLLGMRRDPAILGSALFFLSPWAGEAFFWVSSQFDLFAALFSLLALLLAFRTVDTDTSRPAPLVAAVFLLSALACLSKEMAVPLPGLFLALCLWRRGRAGLDVRSFVAAGSMAAAALLSLVLRSRVLEPLGGAYGSLPALWKRTDLAATLGSQLRAILLPPGGPAPGVDLAWALPLGLLVLAAVVAVPRRALPGLAALALSLAPVAWSALEKGSTAGGRYLYIPGLFVAALAALGFEALLEGERTRRLAPVAAALLLSAGVGLLVGQQRLWKEAVRLSRTTVDQVIRQKGSAERLHLLNLPFSLAEGPFVLKSYAFSLYLDSPSLSVRSEAVILDASGNLLRTFPDPFSAPPPPPATPEKEIRLTLRH